VYKGMGPSKIGETLNLLNVKQFFVQLELLMLKAFNKAELSFDLTTEIGYQGANSNAFIDHQLDADIVIKRIAKSKL
jgi:hypothetical protein